MPIEFPMERCRLAFERHGIERCQVVNSAELSLRSQDLDRWRKVPHGEGIANLSLRSTNPTPISRYI
jgi:hypothetical protein